MSAQKMKMRRTQAGAAENFLEKFCQSCCEEDEEVNVFKGVELQVRDSNGTTNFDNA
jgi:hypothetical protein